tara:strand:- start:351 stop:557 length:207 start_codon:yes stop_codon:yes gene_type:complete
LPEAYFTLYQSYDSENSNPEAIKTFSKPIDLLESGPQVMADYFGKDDPKTFDGEYFSGFPLQNKSLNF